MTERFLNNHYYINTKNRAKRKKKNSPVKEGTMEIWKYGNMEIWKYGNMEIWKYGNIGIWVL